MPISKFFTKTAESFSTRANQTNTTQFLMDAFGSLFTVPFQLTTVEAVAQINRALRPDGVVIFNIGGAVKGKASRFLQAELATYKQVFPQVYLFKVRPERADEDVQNLIIVASKSVNPIVLKSDDAQISKLLENLYKQPVETHESILTDDLAPVEYDNSFAQSVSQR